MSLPDRSTKHIPKHLLPVGSFKNGRIKIKDPVTGKVSWRGGRKGLMRDWDGKPTSHNYNKKDAKQQKSHTVHTGRNPNNRKRSE
jgi:hypothetical protein